MIEDELFNGNNVKMLKVSEDLHRRLKSTAALKRLTLYEYTEGILEKGLLEE